MALLTPTLDERSDSQLYGSRKTKLRAAQRRRGPDGDDREFQELFGAGLASSRTTCACP